MVKVIIRVKLNKPGETKNPKKLNNPVEYLSEMTSLCLFFLLSFCLPSPPPIRRKLCSELSNFKS